MVSERKYQLFSITNQTKWIRIDNSKFIIINQHEELDGKTGSPKPTFMKIANHNSASSTQIELKLKEEIQVQNKLLGGLDRKGENVDKKRKNKSSFSPTSSPNEGRTTQ